MLQIYLMAIAVFGILIGVIPISAMVAHAQNDDKSPFDKCSNIKNNHQDFQACENACWSAGIHDKQQNNPINQDTLNKCNPMQGAYYKGYCGSNICKQLPNSPDSGSNSNDNDGGGGGGTPASP
jgi:hypothetical protein